MKYLLAFVLLNILAVDAFFYAADKKMRDTRDFVCKSPPAVVPTEGQFSFAINRSSFAMVSLSIDTPHGLQRIELYGCDANGHRYRFWKH
jgi:hypothetical protein